jgi:predicted glycosyltransferase
MKLLFHLGHPAHFHLFRNVIKHFINKGDKVFIVIKKKDVLEDLIKEEGLEYQNILPGGRKDHLFGIALGQIKQDVQLLKFCLKNKPDLLLGSTPTVAHIGKLCNIPSINLSEDDARAVMLYAKITYPFSDVILSPSSCYNDKWDKKTIKYDSYHELAYLHPDHFTPDKNIANQYINTNETYYIIRFSKLNAYHDVGIKGLTTEMAIKLISKLEKHGKVLITSEKLLPEELRKYQIKINPKDMHHIMAFASLYIGDSQTMAAEAGVLGTPFIRVNDFVGKLGYLNELENKYQLGYGIKPDEVDRIFNIVDQLLSNKNLDNDYAERRRVMLTDKLNFSTYLIDFIEDYMSNNKKQISK